MQLLCTDVVGKTKQWGGSRRIKSDATFAGIHDRAVFVRQEQHASLDKLVE